MPDFTPVAAALRAEVLAFYSERGQPLEGEAGHNTLETNSGFVERRGRPLLRMLGIPDDGQPQPLSGVQVLDVGCGFGALSVFLAFEGAQVTGLDPNQDRFVVGRAVSERFDLPVRFVEGPMEAMPLTAGACELAVVNNSLCYVTEPAARSLALSEILRVLQPSGRVVIRNPNRWSLTDQFTGLPIIQLLPSRLAGSAASRLGRPRSNVRLLSPRKALRELQEAGFAEVRHHGFPGTRRPDALKLVARYQHLTARRAADEQPS